MKIRRNPINIVEHEQNSRMRQILQESNEAKSVSLMQGEFIFPNFDNRPQSPEVELWLRMTCHPNPKIKAIFHQVTILRFLDEFFCNTPGMQNFAAQLRQAPNLDAILAKYKEFNATLLLNLSYQVYAMRSLDELDILALKGLPFLLDEESPVIPNAINLLQTLPFKKSEATKKLVDFLRQFFKAERPSLITASPDVQAALEQQKTYSGPTKIPPHFAIKHPNFLKEIRDEIEKSLLANQLQWFFLFKNNELLVAFIKEKDKEKIVYAVVSNPELTEEIRHGILLMLSPSEIPCTIIHKLVPEQQKKPCDSKLAQALTEERKAPVVVDDIEFDDLMMQQLASLQADDQQHAEKFAAEVKDQMDRDDPADIKSVDEKTRQKWLASLKKYESTLKEMIANIIQATPFMATDLIPVVMGYFTVVPDKSPDVIYRFFYTPPIKQSPTMMQRQPQVRRTKQ